MGKAPNYYNTLSPRARGDVMRTDMSSAYFAGDRLSQEMSAWHPNLGSADGDFLRDRNLMIARVRDMARNSGWISGAVSRAVDQAVGPDYRLAARPDYRALGLTSQWMRDWSRTVEAKWRSASNHPNHYMDALGQNSVAGIFNLAFRHFFLEGECIAAVRTIDRKGFKYKTAFQVIDPDRLSNPNGVNDNRKIKGGVERDDHGAPVAYYIRNGHPGDGAHMGNDHTWTRVPRFNKWGRYCLVHFFEGERADQSRGISRFIATLGKVKMLDKFERLELQAVAISALLMAYLESPMDTDFLEQFSEMAEDGKVSAYQEFRKEYHKAKDVTIDGARIPTLAPGETLHTIKSDRPNTAFAEFERAVLRNIASSIGTSYEQLAMDWTQTNYSSARAALLESWKYLMARRIAFNKGFADKLYLCWLEEAIMIGEVDLPDGAPAFHDMPAAYGACRWLGPGRGWVDPVKEAAASAMRIESGLSTQQQEAAEQGLDWEEVNEQLAMEAQQRHTLGLAPIGAGAFVPGSDDDPDAKDRDEKGQSNAAERLLRFEKWAASRGIDLDADAA